MASPADTARHRPTRAAACTVWDPGASPERGLQTPARHHAPGHRRDRTPRHRACALRIVSGAMARPLSPAPLLSALVALCAVLPDARAQAPVEQTAHFIRNGTRAPQIVPLTPGQQLAIGFLFTPGNPSNPFCTGTLVAPRVVVTASHCTRGMGPEALGFGIGVDPNAPAALFTLVQVAEFTDPDIDAALLFLERDAVADVPDVEPLPVNRTSLDGADGESLIGRQVEVAGYGQTGEATSGRFFASVRLVELDPEFVVVDGEGLQGLCFGDSGGPVITLNAAGAPVVLGVEHGGDDSCVGRDYLTRLDPLGDWLMAAVAATEPLVEAGGPCAGLTFRGRCTGNTAEWCDEGGQVAKVDCGVHGRGCGFIDDETGYYCNAEPACELGTDGRCLDDPEGAGFIADGAQRVQFVGGCAIGSATPTGSDRWPAVLSGLCLLLAVYRRRNRS